MERRVLVAVFLSFLVLYAYQAMFAPPPPVPPQQTANTAASGPSAVTPPSAAPTPAQPPPPAVPLAAAVVGDSAEREVAVETTTVEATLTNSGGRIVHWRLKDYRDANNQPVDLVPSALPPDQPSPFALRVDDQQITARLNTALYRVSGETGGRLDAQTNEGVLTFDFEDAAG